MSRIYLSPPHLTGQEQDLVAETFESNWIAPLGPQVDAFEAELGRKIGIPHAAALTSGTAALHLGLRLLGVGAGDRVLCPTLTFAATANAVRYLDAEPVFLDVDPKSWNLDPSLLRQELEDSARAGRLPKAVIAVDLYGQSADYEPIEDACREFDVPLLEDAAEALGATYRGKPVGGFGACAAFSFNGNKIITTSGGGMLVSANAELVEKARFLATQARDPAPHYQHSTIGYNYRLSNVLAAIGRAQLRALEDRVAARRRNFEVYSGRLGALPGIGFMPEADYGVSTRWLTCTTIDAGLFGATPEDVRLALEAEDIEARPLWKPLHLQPVFEECRAVGGAVAEELFTRGLCLPSGSALGDRDLDRICSIVRSCHPAGAG